MRYVLNLKHGCRKSAPFVGARPIIRHGPGLQLFLHSLMSYRRALATLQAAQTAVRRLPPIPLHPVDTSRVASPEHKAYDALHARTLASLSLRPLPTARGPSWRHDILRAIDSSGRGERWLVTGLKILEGKLATQTTGAGVRTELAGAVGGIEVEEDLQELLALILVTLSLRRTESTLLDPMARSLQRTLRLFTSNLLDSPSPVPPPPSPLPKSKLSKKSTPSPTREQLAIIHSPTTPGITRINAYAGTGKTTALVQLAEELCRKNSKARILYLSFNKSVERAAKAAFQKLWRNITCQTINSTTYRFLCARHGKTVIDDKIFDSSAPEHEHSEEPQQGDSDIRELEPAQVVEALALKDGYFRVPNSPFGRPKKLGSSAIGALPTQPRRRIC